MRKLVKNPRHTLGKPHDGDRHAHMQNVRRSNLYLVNWLSLCRWRLITEPSRNSRIAANYPCSLYHPRQRNPADRSALAMHSSIYICFVINIFS